ncbi:RNA polymerase sigma factor [Thiosocius teredinicola]|uniref:RNA polymerase sigma factor n=1 Tax=Thiosocius teredinicola TaxID=1973002 RepID=UPI000990EA24
MTAQIPSLRRYARALTGTQDEADDLVQDCLARAWSRMHMWQPGSDLRKWLFAIMHNLYVNNVRRSARTPQAVPLDDVAASLPQRDQAADSLHLRDLESAFAKLSPDQKQVLLLVSLEGLSYSEVALMLDVPLGTVMSRLHRARQKLRELLGFDSIVSLRAVK